MTLAAIMRFAEGSKVSATMSHIDRGNGDRFAPRSNATARLGGALISAALLFVGAGDAAAFPEGDPQARAIQAASGRNPPPLLASLSKFEARRIRHSCQQRANDPALKGSDREAFLARCFFGRSAQRHQRRECAKQGAAKGLDKAALHEFIRECAKEPRQR
jgi:hypothetical protein